MIYIVLNVVLAILLLWFSSFADIHSEEEKTKPIINYILILAVVCFLISLSVILSYFGNLQLINIIGKVILCLITYLVITYSSFLLKYPLFKKNVFLKALGVFLEILAIYIVITKLGNVTITEETGLLIVSEQFSFLPVSWYQLFFYLYFLVIPAVAVISILLRLEVTKNKLYRQQMVLSILITFFSWSILWVLRSLACSVIPMFNLLFPFVMAILIFLLYRVVVQTVLYDLKSIFSASINFFFNFLLISVLAGVSFALLQNMREKNFSLFVLVYIIVTGVLITISYQGTKFYRRMRGTRDSNYSQHFESEIASLDYNESTEVLNEKLLEIFKNNVHTETLDLLIETGDIELTTLYSSRGRRHKISENSKIFDVAMNANRPIIFKSHAETRHDLASVREELIDLFNESQSEVLILLNEGRHVFGAILLGEKHLGNAYTDYDYNVFSKLYSYFFVLGYYMKNIANEAVVGTVNREIQMSGQIIDSIQKNMDFIVNPKLDVGYSSVAAHNLGGEYIDFIRLTDQRHIIVLGDVSGKGINASMSMVILKSIVRTFLAETRDFKQLVQKVNSFIRDNLSKGTFFAGVFCLLDFSDNTMYYINCGIPALLMYTQAYNNVIEIQGEGRILGFVKNIEKYIKVKRIKLNPGDIILGCTDGLINSKSIRGEEFGKDRVQRSILSNLNFPAERMSQFLYEELLQFTSKELEDDVSVITVKCLSR